MKIWLVGIYGAVATTAVVGAKAVERRIVNTTGLVSELEFFNGIEKFAPLRFEFNGHDIRPFKNLYDASLKTLEENHHYSFDILEAVKEDLENIKAKKGTAINSGTGISELGDTVTIEEENVPLREIVERVERDLKGYDVVIDVSSTGPVLEFNKEYHGDLDRFEKMIDEDEREFINSHMIYAYASLKNGIPFANFTPTVCSEIPALVHLADERKVPHAGKDGKTGETLVKSTLAPMFLYRNLEILGWVGYNMLGDYDGRVLSHRDNKESKIKSKDIVLRHTLGYEPYTITEIDLFPTLKDNKTALDFIHFKGFLGKSMKFYFIWDAIDATVAAPLLIDIARFLIFAKKKKVSGIVDELAFFFKDPIGAKVTNTHEAFVLLKEWFSELY